MESRLDYRRFDQEPLQALLAMEKYIAGDRRFDLPGRDHPCVESPRDRAAGATRPLPGDKDDRVAPSRGLQSRAEDGVRNA